jgi:hypothetical protein
MTFMLNYTNPVLESVSDAFVLSEAHAEAAMDSRIHLGPTGFLHDGHMADLFPGIFADQEMESIDQDVLAFPISSPTLMQNRVGETILLLEAQHELTSETSSSFPLDMARSVFTCTNVVDYVAAFFHFFHPHTPFIHRLTFKIEKVSLHLLLAVVLVGSIFCTPQDNALAARFFFSLAEELVFKLLRDMITRPSCICNESVQVVQAAVLIHALKVNSNHEGVRLRVRVNRFPEIIAAMRHLGLFGVARINYEELGDWEQFVVDETRIRYG